MSTAEEIVAAFRALTKNEQERVLSLLRARNDNAEMPTREEALRRWRERSGTARSDFSDVSSSKNDHLADVASDK